MSVSSTLPSHRLHPLRLHESAQVAGGQESWCTILFCDMRGYSALAEFASPARLAAFVSGQLSLMAEIVADHHGEVAALTGDGVMAVFEGAGNETDGLTCAQTMQEMLADVLAGALAVGIGVATGPVATMVVQWSGRRERSVVGDAVNVARRLESQAGPGEILATITSVAAAEGVRAEPLGPRFVKGRKDPVEVCRVRLRKVPSP